MWRRLLIVLGIAVVAAAAPARAWCEATCLAPATASQSHCPTHEPAGDPATMSATSIDDCPILESARPPISTRPDIQAIAIGTYAPALTTRSQLTPSFVRPHSATTVFERCTPLRI